MPGGFSPLPHDGYEKTEADTHVESFGERAFGRGFNSRRLHQRKGFEPSSAPLSWAGRRGEDLTLIHVEITVEYCQYVQLSPRAIVRPAHLRMDYFHLDASKELPQQERGSGGSLLEDRLYPGEALNEPSSRR